MDYKHNPEYETAKSRVSTLIAQISNQLQALQEADNTADVDTIIAEQEKSNFIAKQAEIINGFCACDTLDERDTHIAKLEDELKKAESNAKYYSDLWYKERQKAKDLKAALKSLTAVLNAED